MWRGGSVLSEELVDIGCVREKERLCTVQYTDFCFVKRKAAV